MAYILLWSSAVRVHDSQACRKMDVTRERISCILELREILLSIQTGFSLVNAAVVCAILESISGLEPSSVITVPRRVWPWLTELSDVVLFHAFSLDYFHRSIIHITGNLTLNTVQGKSLFIVLSQENYD